MRGSRHNRWTRWAAGVVATATCLLSTVSYGADVTISFWNNWDGSRAAQLRSILDVFEKENPGIKVENVTLTNVTTTQRMLAALASGDVPELYMTNANAMSQFASLGAFMPLDRMVKDEKIDLNKTFYESGVAGSAYEGQLLQFPFKATSPLAIWYNKDLFKAAGLDPDKPPKTWQELQDAAAKLTKVEGNVVTQLGINVCTECGGSENMFGEWLSRNNGQLFNEDGTKPAFNSPEGLATLKYMIDLSNKTAGSWDNAVKAFGNNYKDLRPAFYAGKLAMTFDGPYLLNIIRTDAPNTLDRTGVFLMPVNGANAQAKQVFNGYGVGGYAIPAKVKHPKEAFKLLKFMAMSDTGACAFFNLQNRADSPYRDCKAGLEGPLAETLIANKDVTVARVTPPTYPKILVRIQQMQQNALLGKQTPEEALKQAAADVQKILLEP
jgi:multiple sugar transport system substrate-binding protein